MAKRQTKAVNFARIADKIQQIKTGRKMPRIRTNGSIATKPCVPCPDIPESEVTDLCVSWLRKHGCTVDRLNNGAGLLEGSSTYRTYGIIGGGDFLGMLPDGRHLEVEFKKGKGGTLSSSQRKRMKRVRDGNGVYEVIHGVPECEEKIMKFLVDTTPPW